ncbi:hypothetical protein GGR55DRAFT_156626 [Xylaria sp. FL0064]|nr:hypothetical protein GGR55DRAFT_156626 [Xylaria sp. FL0064]
MAQPWKYPLQVHSTPIPWSREDVWKGIANARERRRYQNRINQRARRSRRRNETKACIQAHNHANVTQSDSPLALRQIQSISAPCIEIEKIWDTIKTHDPRFWESEPLVRAFKEFIYINWLTQALRPALLPNLVQFNFVRAMMANAGALGLTSNELEDDAISHFYVTGPWPSSVDVKESTLPSGLQPTDLQRRTFHHPWLDLLPVPRMRDNLLRNGVESMDEDELCNVFCGFGDNRDIGLLVWGVSWDPHSWEVTEDLARSSWAWILEGCWELCESTNKWRAQRGEPPLFFAPQERGTK